MNCTQNKKITHGLGRRYLIHEFNGSEQTNPFFIILALTFIIIETIFTENTQLKPSWHQM